MDNVGIFYGRLEHFTAIWYILKPFGMFFGKFYQEKTCNPDQISHAIHILTYVLANFYHVRTIFLQR
jgi:hypothetical protein